MQGCIGCLKVGLVHLFLSIGYFLKYLSLGLVAARFGGKSCSGRKNGGFFCTAGFSVFCGRATGLMFTICLQPQMQK